MGKTYIRDRRSPIPKDESTSMIMSSIRAKDTKPELTIRKALWHEGIRGYRIHWKKMPGKPDIAFPKKKLAIFVNGCFWHRCPHCKLTNPKTNSVFWECKFEANVERDQKKQIEVRNMGWDVITVLECQIKEDVVFCINLIKKSL